MVSIEEKRRANAHATRERNWLKVGLTEQERVERHARLDAKTRPYAPNSSDALRQEFAQPSENWLRLQWRSAILAAKADDRVSVLRVIRGIYGDLPPDETIEAIARDFMNRVKWG